VLFYCHLISSHLVGLNRFINPVDSLGQAIEASVLDSLRGGVIVIVSSLLAVQPPAVAVLHPEVQVWVAGDEHREDGERGGDLVELEPLVDILISVDGAGRKVRHHVKLSSSLSDVEHAAQADS